MLFEDVEVKAISECDNATDEGHLVFYKRNTVLERIDKEPILSNKLTLNSIELDMVNKKRS